MSHLKLEYRKKIFNMLANKRKCCKISEVVGCNPTTIAKEIKKNRIICKDAKIEFKNKKYTKLKSGHKFMLVALIDTPIVV